MGSTAEFAALNTKLAAIRGRFLTPSDYEQLMARRTVAEIAAYLKEHTHYRDVLEQVRTEDIHRSELGQYLSRKSVLTMESLCHFAGGEVKEFIKALFLRYEVEDLKLVLRGMALGKEIASLRPLFLHSKKYEVLDFERVLRSRGIGELTEIVRDTVFQEVFRNLSEDDLSVREFHAEMNLDAVYFRQIRRKAEKLGKEDREILEDMIGRNIDLINLQWLYRAKVYYSLTPEEILNYTLFGGKRYSFAKLKNIVYSDNVREAIAASLPRRYLSLMDEQDVYMERKIYGYLYDLFVKAGRKGRMNIGKLVAVVHFLEYEIRDIITITESIRYEVSREKMKEFLIRRF